MFQGEIKHKDILPQFLIFPFCLKCNRNGFMYGESAGSGPTFTSVTLSILKRLFLLIFNEYHNHNMKLNQRNL